MIEHPVVKNDGKLELNNDQELVKYETNKQHINTLPAEIPVVSTNNKQYELSEESDAPVILKNTNEAATDDVDPYCTEEVLRAYDHYAPQLVSKI